MTSGSKNSYFPVRVAVLNVQGVTMSIFSVVLALLASMGGFIFGYDTGQISDILLMDDFKQRFAECDRGSCTFSDVRSGLIVALLSIGTLIGSLIGAPVSDFCGRRNAMSINCGIFSVGVLIQITSYRFWLQFAIGRFVSGLGIGGLSAVVPTYIAECTPPQIRGSLTGTYQLFITFGILIAYCICIGTRELGGSSSWRIVVGLGIAFALFLGINIQFMPESPRWSILHDDANAARTAISRVRSLPVDHPIVNSELQEILRGVEAKDHKRTDSKEFSSDDNEKKETFQSLASDWFSCFRGFRAGSSRLGYRTVLGMALQGLQQLTGANYFIYYGATIFQAVGVSDPYVTQILIGVVNFVCTFLGLYAFERFGRRIPLIFGGVWQSLWLFVFAAAGTAKEPSEDKAIGKLMIVSACLFFLGMASTWAPGTWIVISEYCPTHSRAKQVALSTASNWLFNFLLAFFTPMIVSALDFRYGFIFAACNFTGAIVVYFFVYESAGMSLENVDLMYRDARTTPWTSRRWVPSTSEQKGCEISGVDSKEIEEGL
ncbi:hypothetical protein ACEPAI_1330 [Sanghuangporus weigelae]